MTRPAEFAPPFDVETYIANGPRRTPRFTESDLRIVAEHAYAQGYQDSVDDNDGGVA